jgi:hypothetical protein
MNKKVTKNKNNNLPKINMRLSKPMFEKDGIIYQKNIVIINNEILREYVQINEPN